MFKTFKFNHSNYFASSSSVLCFHFAALAADSSTRQSALSAQLLFFRFCPAARRPPPSTSANSLLCSLWLPPVHVSSSARSTSFQVSVCTSSPPSSFFSVLLSPLSTFLHKPKSLFFTHPVHCNIERFSSFLLPALSVFNAPR